jgi:Dolichyl-phosphate-mannose-protein mannosyltransferase
MARIIPVVKGVPRVRLGIVSLLIVALVIRLYRLSYFSLWLDEILEGYWIRGSWKFFWASLRFDAVHPPLDYLIARFVDSLRPGEAARKIPDVVYGLGSIVACYRLALLRGNRAIALTTATLLTFAPFHVRYSQEFRPHILGLLAVTGTLVALEEFLRRPIPSRFVLVFAGCVVTEYSLYLGTIVLAIAATALLVEDAYAKDRARRSVARRVLWFSPLITVALWIAFLPWWSVVREAARRAPFTGIEPLTLARLRNELAFFTVGGFEGDPLRWQGIVFGFLAVAGLIAACRRPGMRFLAAWLTGGWVCIEILGRIHPHYYAARRILCVAPALVIIASIPLGVAIERRGLRRIIGVFAIVIFVIGMSEGLDRYFTHGRSDWRPLTAFLKSTPPEHLIFTENPWTQLCVAYYVDGPDWLYRQTLPAPLSSYGRPILNLDGQIVRLTWSWQPGTFGLMVLAAGPEDPELRRWATQFDGRDFPTAEGHARLVLLDPSQRSAALRP